MSSRASALASLASAALGLIAGCESGPRTATPAVVAPEHVEFAPERPSVAIEPWSFRGREGRELRTPSYRICTTERDRMITGRIAAFMETALEEYRSLMGASGSARPTGMEVYLLADRAQWAEMTLELMGDEADTFLRIQRGGFTAGGRSVLYDLGSHDTFAIASHEGWHQFTQRSFRQPLPLWMEEGIAAYMEGFRWRTDEVDLPGFLPWANPERFDQLRYARWRDALLPLEGLLSASPQELIDTTTSGTLTYYAQSWALIHFLREGAGGRYREAFERVLADAAAGRLGATVQERVGSRVARESMSRRRGPGVFQAYFNADLDEAGREFEEFLATITVRGAKSRIIRGESPLSASTPSVAPPAR